MGLKVAIIGLSRTTHHQAPFERRDWEKWGLPWDHGFWRMYDRLFEMHDMRLLKDATCRPVDYLDQLRESDAALYMQEAYPETRAIRYPFEEVSKTVGGVFNSSIAYMLALAIHEGAEEIGIYGVDMKDEEEYFYQRPNCEYLIGVAIGRGIKVHIPKESPLCKFINDGISFCKESPVYQDRYGWLG